MCGAYVELLRNVPLLLQLFIWYFVLTELLPPIDEALRPMAGVFFSKNGLQFPIPLWATGHWATLAGFGVGLVGGMGLAPLRRRAARAPPATRRCSCCPRSPSLIIAIAAGWLLGGAPSGLDVPEKTEINVIGGGSVTPEFLTVLLGLTIYTAAFIAEVVRAGIQSVPLRPASRRRWRSASRARKRLRLVLLPQALRVIIPPMTNQYLNLTKNSSLAVAIGYPDLVSISNTVAQPDRARDRVHRDPDGGLSTLSLLTSALMNWYNRRVALIRESAERATADERCAVFAPIDSRPPPVAARRRRRLDARATSSTAAQHAGHGCHCGAPAVAGAAALRLVGGRRGVRARQRRLPCRGRSRARAGAWSPRSGRLILFGRYPYEEQWRPLAACAILIALLVASCLRPLWKPWLAPLWVLVLALCFILMRGGVFGLTPVETARWGGLPLTLVLAVVEPGDRVSARASWWRSGAAPSCRRSARCA